MRSSVNTVAPRIMNIGWYTCTREDSIAKRIRVFVEKVFSCHIYFTRYEHFPAGFWHTLITQK